MSRMTTLAWLVMFGLVAVAPAQSQTTPPTAVPPTSATGSQPKPDPSELLGRMAQTLAQAQRFSVNVAASYDVVQPSGQKVTFDEQRAIVVSRPDKIKLESVSSEGRKRTILFDGSAITVSDPRENVYGRVDMSGTIDKAVRHLVSALNVRVPLALMLVTSLPTELQQRIRALDYIERDVLSDVPSHHLAGRTEDVDFEIWIAAEGPPVPHRVAITYKHEDSAPQYRAGFSDWDFDPQIAPTLTAFEPPPGAQRIPFLVRQERRPLQSAEGKEEKKGATPKGTTK